MSLFSWLAKEGERGRQAAQEEAQARANFAAADVQQAVSRGEQYDKRSAEYDRAVAMGDSESARKAKRLMDLYSPR